MTPLLGFRTDKTMNTKGTLAEIRPAAAMTEARPRTPPAPSSPRVADYAYRIAALTAGLALLASVW